MPRLGAHMSIAGGLPRAVERAVVHGCEAMQIFAKNASQWRGRVLLREEVREFRAKVAAARLTPVVSHGSYLINLATARLKWPRFLGLSSRWEPWEGLRKKSVTKSLQPWWERFSEFCFVTGWLARSRQTWEKRPTKNVPTLTF